MNSLLTFIIAQIVQHAPVLAIELVHLLSQPAPSDQDWEKLKQKYAGKSYDQYLLEARSRS